MTSAQPDLFGQTHDLDVPSRHLRRVDDPETSRAASIGDRSNQRRRCLAAIADAPGTWADVEYRTGIPDPDPWRRVSDLLRDGFIEPIVERGRAVTRKLPSGRAGRVYRVTEKGRTALANSAP